MALSDYVGIMGKMAGGIGKNPALSNWGSSKPKTSPVKMMINNIGKYLKPAQRFDQVMPYETFAAPQRAVFSGWQNDIYRPEFERFTLNPFKQQYADTAAATNANMMGGGKYAYDTQLTSQEKDYNTQLENAKTMYEQMIEGDYQRRMQEFYDSPTAFSTIGDEKPKKKKKSSTKTAANVLGGLASKAAQTAKGWGR